MFGLKRKLKDTPPEFPKLIKVTHGVVAATAGGSVIDLVIEADFGNGPEVLPFTYAPGENSVMARQVAKWFKANPRVKLEARDRPPTIEEVKYEAQRRIRAIVPRWKMERAITGGKPIPAEDQARAQAVRDASNRLEQLPTIPFDYTDDKYWV